VKQARGNAVRSGEAGEKKLPAKKPGTVHKKKRGGGFPDQNRGSRGQRMGRSTYSREIDWMCPECGGRNKKGTRKHCQKRDGSLIIGGGSKEQQFQNKNSCRKARNGLGKAMANRSPQKNNAQSRKMHKRGIATWDIYFWGRHAERKKRSPQNRAGYRRRQAIISTNLKSAKRTIHPEVGPMEGGEGTEGRSPVGSQQDHSIPYVPRGERTQKDETFEEVTERKRIHWGGLGWVERGNVKKKRKG